ncbi:MAG TPA: hypothetical protein VF628_14205 [Allosphingosinicella sp.]
MRAALLLLLLASGCGADKDRASDGRYDGMWTATTIDGQAVAPRAFLVRVRGGRVVGGKDGCNHWVFDLTRPPEPDGTRTIATDLMACPGVPPRPTYWRALGNGNAVPDMTPTGELRLRAGGSVLLARRLPAPIRPGKADRP